MYNKKVLIDSLKSLGSAKAPVKRQDVLVDPSGNPLMSNGGLNEKPYKKVSIQKSNIQGKGLFADEPIRAGEIIGLSHIKSSFQKDGETYLKSKETPVIGTYYNHSDDAFNAGSIIQGNKRYLRALKNIQPGEEIAGNYYEDNDPTLETPDDFKKGGSSPKMPRKKNSRGYSRSLDATNKFFTENSFFAKPKSRKNKVYDPNAKYYNNGGISKLEGDLISKVIMERNRGVDFVDRAYALGDNPGTPMFNLPDDEQFGQNMSHKMAWGDDDNGQAWMYPTIMNPNNEAIQVPNQYADYISSEGYKNATGMNPYKAGGALLTKKVTCKKCGWKWDAADGGDDITTCHKCGGQGLVHAQDGGEYFELDLTPEEIQQYAEGGFIVEDISVPELTKANLGKIVKTVRRPASRTLITPPSQRGVTTYLPPNENSVVDLRNIPIDFDVKQLKFPLTIAGDSGYFSAYPNNKVEDNIFHFATKMTNPMEAGRAMKLINDSFPQAFPSILEPHSLSLDSYNLLLNMAKRKDWDMNFENYIPLNFVSEKSKLFDGIEGVPRGFRTIRSFDPKVSTEMIDRINAELQGRGLMEKAFYNYIPGDERGEIRIPNYKLTRKYNLGGIAKVASKLTPGNALRASLYKGVNPANYHIIEKFTGMPSELYKNTFSNDNRAFRTGMSLKYGAPEYLSKLLNNLDVSKSQWDKFSEADKIMAIKDYDPEIMMKLEDIGKRRLDAWAVGLKQPQEYNTLEQIGDNTYKMLGLQHTPQFFAERKNDIIANSFKGQAWDGKRDMLVGLTKDFYDLNPHPLQKINSGDNRWADLRRSQIDEFLGQPVYHHPWMQTYNVGKSPDPEFTDAIYDNDSYGVRGGYRWDVRDTPEGMQWKAYDKWDLNPFEKRGSAFISPSSTAKKYLSSTYFKPLQNLEALGLVGGKPFNIENNFLVDPKTFKTVKQWEDGGSIDYTLGDEIDEATMKKLEKLGYTFEKI
jgi:hypothetical protein